MSSATATRPAPATSMRRLSCQKISAHDFWLEGATLARREWISLPYELARESGSRLDPMSLRAECDHLVIGLALRRLCRRTVITPRLASIPSLLLKAVLFLFVWFRQALPPGSTLGTWFFLGKFNQRFAQTLPSHSILLGDNTLTIPCLRVQPRLAAKSPARCYAARLRREREQMLDSAVPQPQSDQ